MQTEGLMLGRRWRLGEGDEGCGRGVLELVAVPSKILARGLV